jgi:hypothetical protein
MQNVDAVVLVGNVNISARIDHHVFRLGVMVLGSSPRRSAGTGGTKKAFSFGK